jgi:hypothetical protein
MSRVFEIQVPPERAYRRRGFFALELLDPVTLDRVNAGIVVVADGLRAQPFLNSSGMFVWLNDGSEDIGRLRRISIDPRTLPYDAVELLPAQLNLPPLPAPVTTIEMPPRVDYPFSAGTTAARGTLIEERPAPNQPPTPVQNADVHLRWLDDDGTTWRDAPTISRTNSRGDFVAVLRLAAAQVPHVDANGAMTVRLRVRREGSTERQSPDFKLPQGRVADPSTLSTLTFAWDELQP